MQVDIKTTTVTQLRQTFSHVARQIGGDGGLLGDDQRFTHANIPCLQSVVSRARAHMYVFNLPEFST